KEQSKETQKIINKIKSLNNEVKKTAQEIKSPYIAQIVDFIFEKPIFNISDLSKAIKSNRVTASRIAKRLLSKKIINSFVPPKKKRKLFVFSHLIRLLNY
ncbi:hypothetical protein J7J18_05325, partial [bacterium]|nr:hypothetical protein [bacterium]